MTVKRARLARRRTLRYNEAYGMKLTVNGEQRQTEASTVRELVVDLGLGERAVAVEVNKTIVPRLLHEKTPLRDGDAVEIVTLVGGG